MPLVFAALLLALAPASADPDCADPKTNIGRFLIERGEARSCDKPLVPDRQVTPKEQARVKAYFDKLMFDAPSARWRFVKLHQPDVVCGFVNGKNQLGGYTGWTPFAFHLESSHGAIYQESDEVWLFKIFCPDVEMAP